MTAKDLINALQTLDRNYEIHPEMTVNFLMVMAEGLKIPEKEKHVIRHKRLHEYLDELVADMIQNTSALPSKTSVMQLMEWSNTQTAHPVTKTT